MQTFGRRMFSVSLPPLIEQTLIMITSVLTMMIVGGISADAIAITGMCNTIGFVMQALYTMPMTGVTVLVARMTGEGDREGASCAVRQTMLLMLALTLVVTALCAALAGPTIAFFAPKDPAFMEAALAYYRTVIYSMPGLMLTMTLCGALRGAGGMLPATVLTSAMNVVYFALSYVMTAGVLGLPRMGVVGAGWALLIARYFGAVTTLIYFAFTRGALRLTWRGWRVRPSIMLRLLRVGVPSMVEQLVSQGGFALSQKLIGSVGTDALTVYQVSNSINSIVYAPLSGLGVAATTLVGQALGKNNPREARGAAWRSLVVGIALTLAGCALAWVYIPQLTRVYMPGNPELAHLSYISTRLFLIACPCVCVYNLFSGALKGAGDMIFILLTSLGGLWAVRILLLLVLSRTTSLGVLLPAVTLLADFIVRAAMFLWRVRGDRWLTIRV